MCKTDLSSKKRRLWPLAALIVAAFFAEHLATPPGTFADEEEGSPYVRIEEDWVLEVLEANPGSTSPQVSTQMAPSPSSDVFCAFQVNYRDVPAFAAGGLQVQIWNNDLSQAYKSSDSAIINSLSETISWTQYMERNGSALKYGISKGTSDTWGDLNAHDLKLTVGDTRTAFRGYDSKYSLDNAGITLGANRVKSLILVEVRKYRMDDALGQLVCDVETTPRVVFTGVAE